MLRQINYNGTELNADFNIRTLLKIAKCYNVDLTGIEEVFRNLKDQEDILTFVATIGSVALTEGARRATKTGEYKSYSVDDLFDMLTVDMSIAEHLLNELFASMEGSNVFPTAPKEKAPKKKIK